jgi:hypothetical protein
MYFNIVITFNDILFLIALAPLFTLFWVMLSDYMKDRDK